MPEVISIGRAALSLRLLLPVVASVSGFAIAWLLLGSRNAALRREMLDLLSSAVVWFLLIWKLTPLVTRFETVAREPLLLLYAPGGRAGVVLGFLGAVGYLLFVVRRRVLDRVRSGVARGSTGRSRGSRGSMDGRGTSDTTAARAADGTVAAHSVRDLARAGGLAVAAAIAVFLLLQLALTAHVVLGSARESVADGSPAARVGAPAPPFELAALDGEPVSLDQFSGQAVLINFWATWCGPCRAETAVKNRLAESFSGRAVVLGVNLTGSETGIAAVRSFVREWGVSYPVLLDTTGAVASNYLVRGTPTTVVLSSDGRVHSRHFGALSYAWGARALRAALAQ